MTYLGKKLALAIPDTVLEERESLRDRTVKLGLISRACSIYGVDLVQVFSDGKRGGDQALIRKVLEYLETPQYLRRRLYPIDETLKFAGLLPPLRIPSHKPKVQVQSLEVGETREGVTNSDGSVDIGLDRHPRLNKGLGANKRVTVRVTSKDPFEVELIVRGAATGYWGYEVEAVSLEHVFVDPRFPLKVATSRVGDGLRSQVPALEAALRSSPGVKLIFGSPTRGLFDLVGADLPRKVDFVLNLFAEQHTETVRTEEAIFAGLNVVSNLIS